MKYASTTCFEAYPFILRPMFPSAGKFEITSDGQFLLRLLISGNLIVINEFI